MSEQANISENPFTFLTTIILVFTVIVVFLSSIFRQTTTNNNATGKLLPPGPKKLPIIGNLHQLGKLPHRSLQNLSKKHGDLMFLQLGSVPTLVISSPDRARYIFKNHDLVFSGRPPLYGMRKMSYNFYSITVAPYGSYWREMRKILVLELMTAKRVQSFWKIRSEEVSRMLSLIATSFPKPVDLSALAFSLSNEIVCRVAFGRAAMARTDFSHGFQEILCESQRLLAEFNIADYFPRMAWVNKINEVDRRIEKNFQDLDMFFQEIIKEHKGHPMRPDEDHEDIIDVLLRIQKGSGDGATTLKDEQIKGVLVDVFVAGTDTSAAAIVWTMAELAKNPTIKQKAQEEVRRVARGKPGIEETDLPKLTYLKQVIKESFRLHPPAPLLVPRETTEKCTIDNKYEIPAKTRVIFNGSAMSTDPGYWESPERFWPERFTDSKVDFRGQHFELLTFGAGRRICPGMSFSTPVVELALANLLFRFDWEIPDGMSIDLDEDVGITMHKKTPLYLLATPPKSEY